MKFKFIQLSVNQLWPFDLEKDLPSHASTKNSHHPDSNHAPVIATQPPQKHIIDKAINITRGGAKGPPCNTLGEQEPALMYVAWHIGSMTCQGGANRSELIKRHNKLKGIQTMARSDHVVEQGALVHWDLLPQVAEPPLQQREEGISTRKNINVNALLGSGLALQIWCKSIHWH